MKPRADGMLARLLAELEAVGFGIQVEDHCIIVLNRDGVELVRLPRELTLPETLLDD